MFPLVVLRGLWVVVLVGLVVLGGVGQKVPPTQQPIPQLPQLQLLTLYFCDAKDYPGTIYRTVGGTPGVQIYTRPSGHLYTFCFHPGADKIYLVNANDNKIYQAVRLASGRWAEDVIYTHSTCIRDIAFVHGEPGRHPEDPAREWHLYFSEASGARENGKIYRIEDDGSISLFYEVRLEDVGGAWTGNFAFAPGGTLYLSSGNRVPARLYRVTSAGVERVYTSWDAPIMGFVFASDTILYYASKGSEIYQLNIATGRGNLCTRPPSTAGFGT